LLGLRAVSDADAASDVRRAVGIAVCIEE